jgi:hypothetical protein
LGNPQPPCGGWLKQVVNHRLQQVTGMYSGTVEKSILKAQYSSEKLSDSDEILSRNRGCGLGDSANINKPKSMKSNRVDMIANRPYRLGPMEKRILSCLELVMVRMRIVRFRFANWNNGTSAMTVLRSL